MTRHSDMSVRNRSKEFPLIRTRKLGRLYRTGEQVVTALKDVSFDINEGEFVAIMGPSGSGKSTLMNLLGTLDLPTSGDYFLDGENVADIAADELADLRNRTIGFVFQQFNLLPRMRALAQVTLPLTYARRRSGNLKEKARKQLALVGLEDRADHLPSQLSGGQQQRVAIARALINSPKLILADEPTGALDTATSKDLMRLFQRLNGAGITIILVTHDAEIAAYAQRKIVFRDGRIVTNKNQRNSRLLKVS
ncbi:putative ABC transporter ATP-binding protein YknY [bacterium MnTg02]|nr:putative ABC transporter ATP-binding protein YknY [bacterium MnTg02]